MIPCTIILRESYTYLLCYINSTRYAILRKYPTNTLRFRELLFNTTWIIYHLLVHLLDYENPIYNATYIPYYKLGCGISFSYVTVRIVYSEQCCLHKFAYTPYRNSIITPGVEQYVISLLFIMLSLCLVYHFFLLFTQICVNCVNPTHTVSGTTRLPAKQQQELAARISHQQGHDSNIITSWFGVVVALRLTNRSASICRSVFCSIRLAVVRVCTQSNGRSDHSGTHGRHFWSIADLIGTWLCCLLIGPLFSISIHHQSSLLVLFVTTVFGDWCYEVNKSSLHCYHIPKSASFDLSFGVLLYSFGCCTSEYTVKR